MNKMCKVLTAVFAISFFIAGCATTTQQTLNASIAGTQGYKAFVPVDPIGSPRVTYFNNKGELVTNAWAQLSNKQIRDLLPNIYTDISVAKRDAFGNLNYIVAKATAETGDYRVVMDYTRYLPESVIDDVSKRELGLGRIGVGMRMTADIHTVKDGIDLSSIFALGVAASLNKLSGTLSVQILGIGTEDVDSLTVTNAKIDETSIQKTLEGMAAIKAKIADDKTKLTPQILWVKPTAAGVTPEEVKSNLQSEAPTSEWVGISNQIDDERLPDKRPDDLAKLPHKMTEDIVRLTFKDGVVTGTSKGYDTTWENSGYLRDGVLVMAYRTAGQTARGFGTHLLVDQESRGEVYIGYLEARECVNRGCVSPEIVKHPYILVKGKTGSVEVAQAKQRYAKELNQHAVAVNPFVFK